jgi:putative DNA primase/helicase
MSKAILQAWARALGGHVSGANVVCPGPNNSRQDRSLSVMPSVASPDRFVCFSHAGDDWLTCRDHVCAKLGLPAPQPRARPVGGHRGSGAPAKPLKPPPDNHKLVIAIWGEARDPRGTLVETYLKSRALELPDEAANEAIRFHPACPFGSERFPSMVCLVRNVITNEPQGIQRTALAPEGTATKRNGKTFRLSLGSTTSGAIKLDLDEDVTQGLCIGEGVETCLTGRQMGLWPVWSVISTSGVAGFPVLPGICGLHIFGERDERLQSEKAAMECTGRWVAAGRKDIFAVWPDVGKDLNDELVMRGPK